VIGSIAAEQIKEISCGKPFNPAGRESFTRTETRPVLQEKASNHRTNKNKT